MEAQTAGVRRRRARGSTKQTRVLVYIPSVGTALLRDIDGLRSVLKSARIDEASSRCLIVDPVASVGAPSQQHSHEHARESTRAHTSTLGCWRAHTGFDRCIDESRFCFGERTGSLRLTQTLPTYPYRYILGLPVPLRSAGSLKTSTQILLFPSCIVCMDVSICLPHQSDRKSARPKPYDIHRSENRVGSRVVSWAG